MRWPWRRQAKPIEPRRAISVRAQELETAKEILAEVFQVRFSVVDEMIQNRYEKVPSQEDNSKGDRLWPQELWVEG